MKTITRIPTFRGSNGDIVEFRVIKDRNYTQTHRVFLNARLVGYLVPSMKPNAEMAMFFIRRFGTQVEEAA